LWDTGKIYINTTREPKPGERNIALALCENWIPVYSANEQYLGFTCGAGKYQAIWGEREDV
jgi:hypothetical protein